ncbi:hypothetical protein GE278_23500 (plasmid) [Enterobacteriaceae bacterium Kacie_13]|nr:hypothetical protein GE278_23500 [Enterobacteriaceae bacterium Kacie_13]
MPAGILMPDKSLQSVHRLLWQPGQALHPSWWAYWGMEDLMKIYPQLSLSGQRDIDGQIALHRCLPDWRPGQLSERQAQLVQLQPKLPLLLTALGLVAMKCSGYVWLRRYRHELQQTFSEQQLSQISVLMHEGSQPAEIQPADLPTLSLNIGLKLISQTLLHEPVWQLLVFTLPRQSDFSIDAVLDNPLAALSRLERFL